MAGCLQSFTVWREKNIRGPHIGYFTVSFYINRLFIRCVWRIFSLCLSRIAREICCQTFVEMYRSVIPLLVCLSVAQTAPQQNSNITYIKPLEPPRPELKTAETESRIENVQHTVPAAVENTIRNSSRANYSQPIYNYSDRIYSIKHKPKSTTTTTEKIIPSTEEIKETSSEKVEETASELEDSDIVPAESITSDRRLDDAERTETEPTVNVETTEKYEEDSTVTTEVYEETTRLPTPRLLPKLSYYEKSSSGSFSQNLIPIPGKRRFRSRCRCEKIWNCAKLQISVPRCPEEYFMCCS